MILAWASPFNNVQFVDMTFEAVSSCSFHMYLTTSISVLDMVWYRK